MGKYDESARAFFRWGRALERILSADFDGAEKALKEARRNNPSVELYLTGQKKLPRSLPDSYSLGSDDEAVICMDVLHTGLSHRGLSPRFFLVIVLLFRVIARWFPRLFSQDIRKTSPKLLRQNQGLPKEVRWPSVSS